MDLCAKQGHCKFAQDFEDFFVVLKKIEYPKDIVAT
jgi:hypothetical protein